MLYTPKDMERLQDKAIALITAKDEAKTLEGGLLISTMTAILRALDTSDKYKDLLVNELYAMLENEVIEEKNPWYADKHMKLALDHAKANPDLDVQVVRGALQ